jgi:hypothetical protein
MTATKPYRISLDLFFFFAEKAAIFKLTEWNQNLEISDELFFELQERVTMSLSRVDNYVKIAKEMLGRKDGSAADFFLKILDKEFGYNADMTFPNVNTWWPEGLNHGIDDIFKKYDS